MSAPDRPRVVVVTGVSGAGKTTVGALLAEVLGWSFYDADAFHPEENITLMRAGKPLTDVEREPWLAALEALIEQLFARGESAVIACSALRREYRERLRRPARSGAGEVCFVFLQVSAEEAWRRVHDRRNHFMPAALIDSQFEALDPPQNALTLDATRSPADLVHEIRSAWKL